MTPDGSSSEVPIGVLVAMEGLDYAQQADPAKVKGAGAHFVCRYLSTPGNPKNLTKAEAVQLRKAGVAIVLVFEIDAQRALGGFQRGAADAKSAREQALACGAPAGQPVYFAVDFSPTSAQIAKVVSYIKGAASVLGVASTGVYGGLAAVKACLDAKACMFGWQTYAWSGGQWDPRAELEQYQNGVAVAGITADRDRAVATDGNYGQWKPMKGVVPPLASPKPQPRPAAAEAVIRGPRGGLIARRPLSRIGRLIGPLLRRFGKLTIKKG